jgi:methionyl-tRNA formyltransferase
MKILFIGCVESSYLLLDKLIQSGADVCGVITKKESNFNSDFNDLSPLCKANDIEFMYSEKCGDQEMTDFAYSVKPDIIYCFGWSYLLKKEIIEIARLGVVGFHPAKLPYNKGRHPIIWALALGLKSTASTFFMIDEKVDNGDIVSQVDLPIDFEDDASTLYKKIMDVACHQVVQFTKEFTNNTISFTPQNDCEGNIWRKRTKEDGRIDFRMSSIGIYNLVRALTKPYVGAHIVHKKCDYKVWSVLVVNDLASQYENLEPGKVIRVFDSKSFLIKTGDGLVKIEDSEEINLRVGDYL